MYYEDLEMGKIYKSDAVKTITGTEIDLVAQISGMDLPGFLSPAFAQRRGFKDRVTPGVYVIACMIGLMAKQGFLADVVAMMGIRDASFRIPLYPGDRVSAETEALSVKETKLGGAVTYKWSVFNQEGKLAAEGTNTCIFSSRAARAK